MEHIAALLLVIGCFDDLAHCRELPTPVSVFESMQACEGALPVSLSAFTEQFEQLYAQCLQVDPAMEEEDAELVWEVHPDGSLVASIDFAARDRIGSTLLAGSLGSTATISFTASRDGMQ